MNSKVPMCTILGFEIIEYVKVHFDGETDVFPVVKAQDLEEFFQSAKRVYFNRAGPNYSEFRTERQLMSTRTGLLIAEKELSHCEKHVPKKLSLDEKIVCANCDVELEMTFKAKESE